MYNLILDEEAIEFLNKLEKPIKERIFNKLVLEKENPLRFFERLAGRSDYKLRVGDYRIIAEIDISDKKIMVVLIGHRKNVYD